MADGHAGREEVARWQGSAGDGGNLVTAPGQGVVPNRWRIEHTKTGPRLELMGMEGGAYAVRLVESDPPEWQWLFLTARNRELEIERADVDATSAELDAAQLAILDAERAS